MDIDLQLYKASQEINAAYKAKAVNRLRNLINTYPDDMRAREALGRLYFDSGFYDAAGLQWFLCEPSAEKEKCIGIYMSTVNHSALHVLKDLKYRGDLENLPEYAQIKLKALREQSGTANKKSYNKHLEKPPKKREASFVDDFAKFGCLLLVLILVVVFILGAIDFFGFIKSLF